MYCFHIACTSKTSIINNLRHTCIDNIMKQNAAIIILTRNDDIRKTYLKTSLYFLFKNFNERFQYPVLILHEGDYDALSQREIIMGVRSTCKHLVSFVALDKDDFTLPSHVDKNKLDNCVATQPVPYWRDVKYRMMCRWWLVHMQKYTSGYEYIMRLDDDAYIEDPIDEDLFNWAHDHNLVYASNMVHVDCGICCYGMKEFFDSTFPSRADTINKMFVPQEIPMRSVQHHPFRLLLSITHEGNPPEIKETFKLHMPIMYYNNFFITKTEFWNKPDVRKTIEAIDKTGNIFYYRWGDAPLHTAITMLHADDPSQIKRAIFKYSKRLQRECFKNEKGDIHSYMPQKYSQSSCVMQDR